MRWLFFLIGLTNIGFGIYFLTIGDIVTGIALILIGIGCTVRNLDEIIVKWDRPVTKP